MIRSPQHLQSSKYSNDFHLCILARTQPLFEQTTLEQMKFSTFQLFQIKHWTLGALSVTPRCEALLDVTQDRKVLAAAQTHLIVQIFAANLYISTLFISKTHRHYCDNSR